MSDTLEQQLNSEIQRIIGERYNGAAGKSFRHAFHRDSTPKIIESVLRLFRAREQAARLEATIKAIEDWGECRCDSYNLKHICKMCKHLAALRASREPKGER